MTTVTVQDDGAGGYRVDLGGLAPREASALRAVLDRAFPDVGPRPAAA